MFAQWEKVWVHIDYHLEVDRHYYCLPHALAGKPLMVRYTETTVACLFAGERIASHARSYAHGQYTTVNDHRPKHHQHAAQYSPAYLLQWAHTCGPGTASLIQTVLAERRHPEQSTRTCLGILRFAKSDGDDWLEAACRYALTLGARSVRAVQSILKHRIDEQYTDTAEVC